MVKQIKLRPAFTLIETLIVVAMIAILVSILVPALAGARAQSRITVCRANLKSMGELVAAYAQENEGRLARGPSFYVPPPSLISPYVATNIVWVGFPMGSNSPQHIGSGLLTKETGKTGNEWLYCPADDQRDLVEEGPRIGEPGALAYSSYLYRQLDMLPPLCSGEYTPNPAHQQAGRLDELGSNPGSRVVYENGGSVTQTTNVNVRALALDANSLGRTADTRRSNHRGRTVNVVYTDGSTNTFENNRQVINGQSSDQPWGSIHGSAFAGGVPDFDLVSEQLDRILMAADFSFLGDPTRAPKPAYPPY